MGNINETPENVIGYYCNDNDGKMGFYQYVELQSINPKSINIFDIFNVEIATQKGQKELINSIDCPENIKMFLDKISWGIRVYNNYQDIFDSTTSSEDYNSNSENTRYRLFNFNRNYCYYESLIYIREIILSIYNGNILGSLVLARPFLELSLGNLYWKQSNEKNTSNNFYKWLLGDATYKRKFSKMIDFLFSNSQTFELLESKDIENHHNIIKDLFFKLCSYNHTPFLDESIGSYTSDTNKGILSLIGYVLKMLSEVLYQINYIYLISYPMTLFPVDRYRRFGYFNGPVGLFNDEYNYSVLESYFGTDLLESLKISFKNYTLIDDLFVFLNSYNTLSDEQLNDSWKEFVTDNLKDKNLLEI